jgi:hypothetical protein
VGVVGCINTTIASISAARRIIPPTMTAIMILLVFFSCSLGLMGVSGRGGVGTISDVFSRVSIECIIAFFWVRNSNDSLGDNPTSKA